MQNEEHIVSYSVEALREMRRRGESRTDWAKVDDITDEQLEALIAEDDDEQDFVPDWHKAKVVMPEAKEHISLRLDADVLRFFKSSGKGYQTRINAVLRSYMQAQQNGRN